MQARRWPRCLVWLPLACHSLCSQQPKWHSLYASMYRDAGCPHCCCLAPVWQDALHHLGYVLPLLMQLDFVGFPHCCLPHSALVSLAFRYLPYRCVDRYSSKCAPPHTLFQMSSCTHLRLKATELTPFFLSCAHHLLGCVPSKSRKCCCFNQLARPEAGFRSCNTTVRI